MVLALTSLAGTAAQGVASAASQTPVAIAPTYGVTQIPGNVELRAIAPDGSYVATFKNYPTTLTEFHVTPKGLKSAQLPVPGFANWMTSVSNDGLVAGSGGGSPPGSSGPGYPTPWVSGPGATTATGVPCDLYTVPDTNLNSPYSYCGYHFAGWKNYAYMAYRAESAYITGDGVVEGTSNCPPMGAAGACGPNDVYADPGTGGGCDFCGTPASGIYTWSGSTKAALAPSSLSEKHSWLLNLVSAVATTGDYAGIVECDTTYPPQPPSAFPCPTKNGGPVGVWGWFVGNRGGDYAISSKTFSINDGFSVNGVNDAHTVVGSWQPQGAQNPIPWKASGTGGWTRLSYPSSITYHLGSFSVTETMTGGEALAINDDGWIVGYLTSNGRFPEVAAMWTPTGKFVLLQSQLDTYDQSRMVLRQAVGVTAGDEILALRGNTVNGNTLLLGPATCSHINLQAPLSYRTGETVIHYHITGITLDCGPVDLTVDGQVVKALPDDPSTQSGEAVFPRRDCQPTVVATQGDKVSEDDEGQGSDGKVLIAKDVKGPFGEGLRAGDPLCTYENGARMIYDTAPQQIAASLKLTVPSNGALAASTVDLPETSVSGPGGLVVPSDSKVTQDIVDDPAIGTYLAGGILGSTLRLDVGGGQVESAALPQVSDQKPADLINWLKQLPGVQSFPVCPGSGPVTITGMVEISSTVVNCGLNQNADALFGVDSSLEIKGPVAGIGSISVAGPLTIRGHIAMIPASGTHYEGGTVKIELTERDYSQPYMVFAPPKTQTVTQEPFDTGGVVIVSSGDITLLGK